MNFEEYKPLIEQWTKQANDSGLKLSDGTPIPTVFWKTFLGIPRSIHLELFNGTSRRKEFSPGLARTIHFAQKLGHSAFLEDVKATIPLYEANKRK